MIPYETWRSDSLRYECAGCRREGFFGKNTHHTKNEEQRAHLEELILPPYSSMYYRFPESRRPLKQTFKYEQPTITKFMRSLHENLQDAITVPESRISISVRIGLICVLISHGKRNLTLILQTRNDNIFISILSSKDSWRSSANGSRIMLPSLENPVWYSPNLELKWKFASSTEICRRTSCPPSTFAGSVTALKASTILQK
jgi:hypothetical protein